MGESVRRATKVAFICYSQGRHSRGTSSNRFRTRSREEEPQTHPATSITQISFIWLARSSPISLAPSFSNNNIDQWRTRRVFIDFYSTIIFSSIIKSNSKIIRIISKEFTIIEYFLPFVLFLCKYIFKEDKYSISSKKFYQTIFFFSQLRIVQ